MKCDYNSCSIKACIPPYNSSEKRQNNTLYLNMAAPIKVIKYGVVVTCFRTLTKKSVVCEKTIRFSELPVL